MAHAGTDIDKRLSVFKAADIFKAMTAHPDLQRQLRAWAAEGEACDPWKPSSHDYDRAIHSNPDASAWADLFVATFPGLSDKRDTMLGWFANAMMAMHDHMERAYQQPEARVVPVATIPADSVDGELSVEQAINDLCEMHPGADRLAMKLLAALFTHKTVVRYRASPAPQQPEPGEGE